LALVNWLPNFANNIALVRILLLSAIMAVAHSAELTYNAALNKTSFQSSVFVSPNFPGEWKASLANDGNLETTANKDRQPWCSASQIETNPWWAVDLGRPTTVYRVLLTNRGDADSAGMYR